VTGRYEASCGKRCFTVKKKLYRFRAAGGRAVVAPGTVSRGGKKRKHGQETLGAGEKCVSKKEGGGKGGKGKRWKKRTLGRERKKKRQTMSLAVSQSEVASNLISKTPQKRGTRPKGEAGGDLRMEKKVYSDSLFVWETPLKVRDLTEGYMKRGKENA